MLGRHAWCGWIVLGVLAWGLFGCGGHDAMSDAGLPDACEALTDPLAQMGDPIDGDTFANTAAPFFDSYCVSCHATNLVTRSDRGGAPSDLNWDQEMVVRMHLSKIRAAVGVTNFMPLRAPFPTCDERARLVRWIDAAAP